MGMSLSSILTWTDSRIHLVYLSLSRSKILTSSQFMTWFISRACSHIADFLLVLSSSGWNKHQHQQQTTTLLGCLIRIEPSFALMKLYRIVSATSAYYMVNIIYLLSECKKNINLNKRTFLTRLF